MMTENADRLTVCQARARQFISNVPGQQVVVTAGPRPAKVDEIDMRVGDCESLNVERATAEHRESAIAKARQLRHELRGDAVPGGDHHGNKPLTVKIAHPPQGLGQLAE